MKKDDDALFAIEQQLRTLIRAEAFEPARAVLALYCEEINRRLSSFPPGGEAQGELARTSRDVLRWADLMVRTSQAHFSSELQQISHLSGYRESENKARIHLQA